MAWLISRARASASRACCGVTRGRLRVRTESRNAWISRSSGSPPWMAGLLTASDALGAALSRRDVDDEQILARVIDGEVLVGLEEAQLANGLRADPAGGEVGDAAGGKFQADVGDVHLGRQDPQPNGMKLAHRGRTKLKHDVQIVDHQVQAPRRHREPGGGRR